MTSNGGIKHKVVAVLYEGGDYAKDNPALLGTVQNALGLREFLAERGVEFVVTKDKQEPDSELDRHLKDATVVISQPFWPAYITRSRMERAPNLKMVLTAGVGSDHVDLEAANEKNITVLECTGTNVVSVAEHVVMQILALVRNFIPAHQQVLDGKWDIAGDRAYDLENMNVGTVAAGRIGIRVLQRLKPFDVKLHYTDKYRLPEDVEKSLNVKYHPTVDSMVKECDVVTINCPLHPETENMFDAKMLSLMKKGYYIVNTARGKIVNTQALVEALESGHLAGYAGDVWYPQPAAPDHPWRTMPHHAMTPHYSGTTLSAQARYAAMTKQILENFFEGKPQDPANLICENGAMASKAYTSGNATTGANLLPTKAELGPLPPQRLLLEACLRADIPNAPHLRHSFLLEGSSTRAAVCSLVEFDSRRRHLPGEVAGGADDLNEAQPSSDLQEMCTLQLELLHKVLKNSGRNLSRLHTTVYARAGCSLTAGAALLQKVASFPSPSTLHAGVSNFSTDETLVLKLDEGWLNMGDGQAESSKILQDRLLVLPQSGSIVMPLVEMDFLVGLLVVEPEVPPEGESSTALCVTCAIDLKAVIREKHVAATSLAARALIQDAQRPLAGLNTFANMLMPRLNEGDPDLDMAKGIAMQGQRLKELVYQLDSALLSLRSPQNPEDAHMSLRGDSSGTSTSGSDFGSDGFGVSSASFGTRHFTSPSLSSGAVRETLPPPSMPSLPPTLSSSSSAALTEGSGLTSSTGLASSSLTKGSGLATSTGLASSSLTEGSGLASSSVCGSPVKSSTALAGQSPQAGGPRSPPRSLSLGDGRQVPLYSMRLAGADMETIDVEQEPSQSSTRTSAPPASSSTSLARVSTSSKALVGKKSSEVRTSVVDVLRGVLTACKKLASVSGIHMEIVPPLTVALPTGSEETDSSSVRQPAAAAKGLLRPVLPLYVTLKAATLRRIASYILDICLQCTPRGGQLSVSVTTQQMDSMPAVCLQCLHTGRLVADRLHPASRPLSSLPKKGSRTVPGQPRSQSLGDEEGGGVKRMPRAKGKLAPQMGMSPGSGLLSFSMAEQLVIQAGGWVNIHYPVRMLNAKTGVMDSATCVEVLLPRHI
eukprot:gene20292-27049_t